MTYNSPYGKAEGLRDRLQDWIKRLSEDKSLPWIGLGLIADLNAAVAALDPAREDYGWPATETEQIIPNGNTPEYDL